MEINNPAAGFEQALAMVPSCTLDPGARRAQKARYIAVARSITGVRREPEAVSVDFGKPVDTAVLEEIIAVERDCCPSLRFEIDRTARRLVVTATDTATLPVLDAIEAAFAGAIQ